MRYITLKEYSKREKVSIMTAYKHAYQGIISTVRLGDITRGVNVELPKRMAELVMVRVDGV